MKLIAPWQVEELRNRVGVERSAAFVEGWSSAIDSVLKLIEITNQDAWFHIHCTGCGKESSAARYVSDIGLSTFVCDDCMAKG